ncbi:uncharacterized protein [Macrobrachium rosenbergii]|uniref:uncharacterized protein n=1 Tax=Macrobrachium rosenbergii TaxID=79674 RepID=UPI0034D6A043
MRRWTVGVSLVVFCTVVGFCHGLPDANPSPNPQPDPDPGRDKRQLSVVNSMLRTVGKSFQQGISALGTTLDKHVVPRVRYAAERISEDVAPTVGNALLRAGNHVVVRTAEGLQATSKFVVNKVMPAIEDTIVDVSNAAVPYINKGIDVIESGIQKSARIVSKSTAKGIDRLGMRVLGEQRHSRIKTIANNIQGGISNGINNLAGAISSLNSPSTPNPDYYTNQDYHDYVVSQYADGHTGSNLYSQDYPQYSHYSPDYTHDAEYPSHPVQLFQPNRDNQGHGGAGGNGNGIVKVVDNAAYALSRQFLGQNLTNALAPIAKRVSNAVGQTIIPAVSFGDGRIVIDLPGNSEETSNPQAEKSDNVRSCTTPGGGQGYCKDLSDCPDLILDLTNLRKSVCFKSLFVPGVCCPAGEGEDGNSINNNDVPPPSTSRPRPPIARPPPPLPSPVAGTTLPPRPIQPIAEVDKNDAFQCGKPVIPTFRVVGGQESRRGQWPWMAAIWLHGPKKTEFWCGGSLISSEYILTAAHCTKDSRGKTFNPQQFTVRLGDHNIFSESDDFISNPQTYRVISIRPHPDFKAHGFYNDVALLKLDRKVDFSEYILPVCLPTDSMARQPLDNMVGQTPSVIGWGSTYYGGRESATLREAQLPVWSNSDCDDSYFQPITEVFLCAGFVEGGRDACQGDSGGPLQLYVDGKWIQIGLVSFGNRCAEPGYPGVYTRLTHFLPWIRNNMS